jgi:L-rhamnose isomerase/sugar isomerase
LVDRGALAKAQADANVLEANEILIDAFNTDVRPLLGELRQDMGLDADPLGAYRRSGYAEKIVAERAVGAAAGWGA